MAGDWIKLRTDLQSDPAVMRLSAVLKLDAFAVIGRLAAVWVWADTHADRHGNVTLVSRDCLDSITQCPGFGAALEDVGWLKSNGGEGGGITFPRFERHMGEGAKARAQAAKRKRNQRERESRSSHGDVTKKSRTDRDDSVTRGEERREEKKEEERPPLPPAKPGGIDGEDSAAIPAELDTEEFRAAWGQWKTERAAKRIKPYTSRGEREQFRKLAPFGPVVAVAAIRESVAQGWQGLFPERVKRPEQRSTGPPVSAKPPKETAIDRINRIAAANGVTIVDDTKDNATCSTPSNAPRGTAPGSQTMPAPSASATS